MISVAEADAIIDAQLHTLDVLDIPADAARGAILAETIAAERDQPPFDRVTMDGAAIAWQTPLRELTSQGNQFAGDPPLELRSQQHAIEIMTGAVLPGGCDTIVPVERYHIDDAARLIFEPGYQPERGQFIHRRASDHPAGSPLLAAGQRIGPSEIAIIASAGRATVRVFRRPRVAIVATGNELIAAGMPVAAHQVRLSNAPALVAATQLAGINAVVAHHLPDEPAVLEREIGKLLETNDVLVLSGGVSRGKADHVPDVLHALGVSKHFHRIAQRPGKPMWFGSTHSRTLVFGLPGNPVSTLCCFHRYVLPALRRLSGAGAPTKRFAALTQTHTFKPALMQMLPVTLSYAGARALATPRHTNTSGDFSALADTDGFLELPADSDEFAEGDEFALHHWQA